jgi:hypothetical protein
MYLYFSSFSIEWKNDMYREQNENKQVKVQGNQAQREKLSCEGQ